MVLSVPLFAALQIPHVPHVQGRGRALLSVSEFYLNFKQRLIWFSCSVWSFSYQFLSALVVVLLQIASLRVQTGDLGQEETVQKCLQNGAWVEGLFDRFGELINQVQQACR